MSSKLPVVEADGGKFLDEVAALPGAEKIRICIQCGTCSGACPLAEKMDHSPRRLFAMIRAGMRDEVLESNTPWLCASCYSCTVRCPQEIPFTDVMYALKNMAVAKGKYPESHDAAIFYKEFAKQVDKYGRSCESLLFMNYLLKTHPLALIGNMVFALKMMKRGLIPLIPIFPTKIKGRKEIREIIEYVDKHRPGPGGE